MQNKKPRVTVVEETADWGVYVWRKANGKIFGDDQGNVMNIKGMVMDLQAIAKITDAAKAFGVAEGGKAEFWPRCRPVSDMEASEQKDRLKQGYIPSETDFGAWEDALRGYKAYGSDY
mgnify:CR=1 FL=1